MLGYNDLYEILRKEKYSEPLQLLPKDFLEEFREYLQENSLASNSSSELFADSIAKSKKQFENSIAIFRELMLKRKRKILNLVFVATETGIMKKDYENMLPLEKEAFDKIISSFEISDSKLSKILSEKKGFVEKKIGFKQNIEQFLDHEGKLIGPFVIGDLVKVNSEIANILVNEGKASFVDEN